MKKYLLIVILLLALVGSAEATIDDYTTLIRFEENIGTNAADSNTTSGNNATLQANATWTSSGKYGAGLVLNNTTSSYVTIADSPLLQGDNLSTVCFWICPTEDYDLSAEPDITFFDKQTGINGYTFYIKHVSRFQYFVGNGSSSFSTFSSPMSWTIGQWYHVAYVFNLTHVSFYRDGIFISSSDGTLTGAITNTAMNVYMGAGDDGSARFNGTIDELYIFDRMLSQSEINETRDNNFAAAGAPSITSYAPTVTIWPEVQDSQHFNVTVNQSTQCRWYINGSLEQTNSTPSTTHSYTNTSLKGGHWNFTAVVNNTNGTDSQTWLFEVGADSITYIVLQDQPTNKSMIAEINVTRIGSNVTDWGRWQNYTYNGWNYTFRYTNGTAIKSLEASYNNESLWFNGTSLLPIGVYFINATEAAVNTSTIIIPINSYGMINNWTTATTFSSIATNESNDVCYTYYNVTTGEWESHYPPYSWNSNYVIPLEASVFMFVDAETTVTATIVTPSSTELYVGWNQLFIQGTDNESISSVISDIGANCTDVWWFNSTSGAYSNTSSNTVQPCQGFLAYITQNFTWTRSDL